MYDLPLLGFQLAGRSVVCVDGLPNGVVMGLVILASVAESCIMCANSGRLSLRLTSQGFSGEDQLQVDGIWTP
jgi:hypothetical protein